MPEHRNSAVIASRRYRFAVGPRPFFAIALRDLADLGFVQARPAFLKCSKAFPPVFACARFDARVVIQIAQMNRSGLAEYHFSRRFTVAIADALPMLFQKFSEPRLRHAVMCGFERSPNFFASSECSGIIPPGLMAKEISVSCSFPRFRCFAPFHEADRRIAP